MRIFPENLATFEQNNFFHILIWDKVERWRPLSMNTLFQSSEDKKTGWLVEDIFPSHAPQCSGSIYIKITKKVET